MAPQGLPQHGFPTRWRWRSCGSWRARRCACSRSIRGRSSPAPLPLQRGRARRSRCSTPGRLARARRALAVALGGRVLDRRGAAGRGRRAPRFGPAAAASASVAVGVSDEDGMLIYVEVEGTAAAARSRPRRPARRRRRRPLRARIRGGREDARRAPEEARLLDADPPRAAALPGAGRGHRSRGRRGEAAFGRRSRPPDPRRGAGREAGLRGHADRALRHLVSPSTEADPLLQARRARGGRDARRRLGQLTSGRLGAGAAPPR